MFTTLAVAARDRKRLAEISGVAARFGLEAVLLRLGLGGGEAHHAVCLAVLEIIDDAVDIVRQQLGVADQRGSAGVISARNRLARLA